MAESVNKRLNYYNGQFLRQEDFTTEQQYHLDRRRLHNRSLHTWGIVKDSLQLTFPVGASSVTVSKGVAIDGEGQELVLLDDTPTEDLSGKAGKTLFVTLRYDEQPTDPQNETGVEGRRRITEKPILEVDENPPSDPSMKLILGRVTVGADGKISSVDEGQDPNRRRSAGVVGGDLEVRSLILTDPNINPTGWARMRLGTTNRTDLQGSLRVSGNIEVPGTVDGRDVSADGTKLDTHVANTSNPHNTTAAQVGALVSLDGVNNPGGNVDLAQANAITLTPDNTNKRITIGESHSARTDNPHSTTAAQVGALVSLDGVNNPGGNVDLVQANAITLNADNTNKRITIGENHSARTDNPHGTTAEQVGALPITGGTITGSGSVSVVSSGRFALYGQTRTDVGGSYFGSANNVGVAGYTLRADGVGVWAESTNASANALVVQGKAFFNGSKNGYVVDRFVNSSGQTLRTGDVVRLKGTPIARFTGENNKIPIPEVVLADTADDRRVIGIVDCEAVPGPNEPDMRTDADDPTTIVDGGELSVVTLGTFAHCKVDAREAPIEVGDLLTSSANAGHAKKATEPQIGSIIGKALEPLTEGTGYIAVFVNIQ